MDIFMIPIIIGVVVTVGGWFFWIAIVYFVGRAAMGGVRKSLEQQMAFLEQNIGQLPQGGFQSLPQVRQQQLIAMLMQAQNQMGQLNDLSRARYETRVGDLMGMAASAGIDWRP